MSAPILSQIAAIGANNELGAGNQLLWHLPDDFAWFVKHTRGHPVIMGRKTMQSLGKPLKNRLNIVISRDAGAVTEGFEYAPTFEKALELAQAQTTDEIFIIGGGEVYKQTMDRCDRLYITRVHATFPQADTFFPVINENWKETFWQHHNADEKHEYSFDFVILEKSPG